jgi:hypothetical protein
VLTTAPPCAKLILIPFSTVVKAKTAATPSLQGINAVSGGGRMLYGKTILKDF